MNSVAFRLFLAALLLAAAPAYGAREDDEQKVRFVLTLRQVDAEFRDYVSASLNQLAAEGKLSSTVSNEIKSEIPTKAYMDALVALYLSKLSSSEIDELLAYFRVSANLNLCHDLAYVSVEYEGQARDGRMKELAERDPATWEAARKFFQSPTGVKVTAILGESEKMMENQCAAMMTAARKVDRDRHEAKSTTR